MRVRMQGPLVLIHVPIPKCRRLWIAIPKRLCREAGIRAHIASDTLTTQCHLGLGTRTFRRQEHGACNPVAWADTTPDNTLPGRGWRSDGVRTTNLCFVFGEKHANKLDLVVLHIKPSDCYAITPKITQYQASRVVKICVCWGSWT